MGKYLYKHRIKHKYKRLMPYSKDVYKTYDDIKTFETGIYNQSKRLCNFNNKFNINNVIEFIKRLPWKYDGKRS